MGYLDNTAPLLVPFKTLDHSQASSKREHEIRIPSLGCKLDVYFCCRFRGICGGHFSPPCERLSHILYKDEHLSHNSPVRERSSNGGMDELGGSGCGQRAR